MNLARKIDHTVLGVETSRDDVERVIKQAEQYGMNICIPPRYVEYARARTGQKIVTVAGFPHGTSNTEIKKKEAQVAEEQGADEVDFVAYIPDIKDKNDESVESEVSEIVRSVDIPVKVIIESNLLSEEEIINACRACKRANADFIKTCTGFSDGGATVEDVRKMSRYLPVKASGGIGTSEKALDMLEAGAERIGASSGHEIMSDFES